MGEEAWDEGGLQARFYIQDDGVKLTLNDQFESPFGEVLVTRDNWREHFNDSAIDPLERCFVYLMMTQTKWPSVKIERNVNMTMLFEYDPEWVTRYEGGHWRNDQAVDFIYAGMSWLRMLIKFVSVHVPFNRDPLPNI